MTTQPSKNNIFFNPSNEQFMELAKEHPELNAEIKQKMLDELKGNCVRYVKNRLQSRTSSMYDALLKNIEQKMFKVSGNSYNPTYNFEPAVEKSLTASIEKKIAEQLEDEYKEFLNSEEFKIALRKELQRKMLSVISAALDAELVAEANKYIKS